MDDGGQTRIDKLYGLIEACRYGIHDLSRTELDKTYRLPRFNMPLELGIFLWAKRYGGSKQKQKRLLILDIEPYRYQNSSPISPASTSMTMTGSPSARSPKPATG